MKEYYVCYQAAYCTGFSGFIIKANSMREVIERMNNQGNTVIFITELT